jgi:A/G-specific adenine glycosylase
MAWRGLGYNNRAVRLHALAKHLRRSSAGRFPRDVEALIQLPGVGRYTAHAMAVFAFGQELPVVDVNVRRALSRIFFRMKTTVSVVDEFTAWTMAQRVLPAGKAYDWNQALMDFGAIVCTAVRPRCTECPVAALCASRPGMKPVSRRRGSARVLESARTSPARRDASPTRTASHRGTPLRLYRGRVIETLRNAHPRRSVSALSVGKAILPLFTERDRRVFHRVLRGLERDGLVEVRRNRRAMPERISLA